MKNNICLKVGRREAKRVQSERPAIAGLPGAPVLTHALLCDPVL